MNKERSDIHGSEHGILESNAGAKLKTNTRYLNSKRGKSSHNILDEMKDDVSVDPIARIMADYSEELRVYSLLTQEEEFELGIAIQMGDRNSLNRMVEANLRLVIKIASHYKNRGVELMDIISEGNLGLIRAAEKFNPHLGYRFSTYATFWIRQFIERYIMNTTRLIRLPAHVIKELNQVLRVKKELEQERPSQVIKVSDIAERMEYEDEDRIIGLLSLNDCLTYTEMPLSREDDDHRDEMHDNLFKDDHTPYEAFENENIAEIVEGWLDMLSENSQEILCYRFGLKGHDTLSLRKISELLNVEMDEIRRRNRVALREIKDLVESLNINSSEFY